MINDSVREELQTKVGVPVLRPEPARIDEPELKPLLNSEIPKREIPRPSPPLKRITTPLSGPKTSPTLVEFQSKNATVPDWRLQLQNSVRQRKGAAHRSKSESEPAPARLVTNGATALKAEVLERSEPIDESHANPKIAKALQRIDESRKTFLASTNTSRAKATPAPAMRARPFNVVSRSEASQTRMPAAKPAISESPRPTLVPTFKIEKKKYDTNKLPPLVDEPRNETEQPTTVIEQAPKRAMPSPPEISIHISKPDQAHPTAAGSEEIEDLAPISMRFNAALFDLIIGAFGSFILLSPVVLIGGDWFSWAGVAAYGAVWASAMFIYMTLGIGMYGKTLGMRMFGLELIDAEENDYPTFHQAAVHSAVFLLALPFLGAGFLPMIFNEEQRAAHDLAAGTMIVTEF